MNITITGMTGSGKSYFARHLIKDSIKPVFALADNLHDIEELEKVLGRELNLIRVGKHTVIRDIPSNTAIVFENVIYEEIENTIDYICSYLYGLGNCIFYVDEAHLFFPNRNIGRSPKELERLLRGGRKKGIDVIMITQRPQDLNLVAISQSHFLIAFKSAERNTIKVIAENMMIDPDKILQLGRYEALIYDTTTGELDKHKF